MQIAQLKYLCFVLSNIKSFHFDADPYPEFRLVKNEPGFVF